MFVFNFPDVGEGIHEGEILKWYVRPGEQIEEDAPLVEPGDYIYTKLFKKKYWKDSRRSFQNSSSNNYRSQSKR